MANEIPEFDFSFPRFRLPSFSFWTGLIAILIVAFIIIDGFVSVPAGHVAVLYDRGRGVLHTELSEGLHLKIPFWQTATLFDTRLTTVDFNSEFGNQVQSLTKDGQSVGLDITIQYRIPADKASEIYQGIGVDYLQKVVYPEARKVIRDEITSFDSTDLFAKGRRKEAATQMKRVLTENYADNGIQLISVILRNVNFSKAYLNAIEDKQIAQQTIQKAKNDLERIKVEAEQKVTAARAEAEAIKLKGQELRTNPQVIQFEFVQKMAKDISWGILPGNVLPLLDLKNLKK